MSKLSKIKDHFLLDSFLRNRSSSDHEATAMMKAQFMSLWDGLDTDHSCQVFEQKPLWTCMVSLSVGTLQGSLLYFWTKVFSLFLYLVLSDKEPEEPNFYKLHPFNNYHH